MRILAVGGGSGGHVTPVVAVLKALRRNVPDTDIRFWCDRKFADQARATVGQFDPTIRIDTILAGKFRRYHHVSVIRQIFWFSLVIANLRDSFLILGGLVQSFFKLIWWRPDVVFTKGGFVCLPVGLAARALRIPLVIHDSDAHPGLTNRILSRYARFIGTGAPLHHYKYPTSKARYVGIPIDPAFHPVAVNAQRQLKKEWGTHTDRPLIVVTGGGLGARRINDFVIRYRESLTAMADVILVAGAGQYDALRNVVKKDTSEFHLYAFVTKMPSLLAAADVVIARAGATTILELAALAKPTILIPNAKLTGGHQLKNTHVYTEAEAVISVNDDNLEDQPNILLDAVRALLDDPASAGTMAARFQAFSKPAAADEMARLILDAAETSRSVR